MTQKELLYVDDAIVHEKSIINCCDIYLSNLQDEDLKDYFKKEKSIHEKSLKELINLLEVKINE